MSTLKVDNIRPLSTATIDGAEHIGYTPTGTVAATNVQTAIDEVVSDLTASTGSSLVGFLQSGIGATSETVQDILRLEVWAEQFGAVGDGVTDDTAFIQAAIDAVSIRGGTVRFAAKDYLVTSLVLKSGVYLEGKGSGKRSGKLVTRLVGTTGSDIITFDDGAVNDVAVLKMKLKGGRRHLYFSPTTALYIVNLWLEDIYFDAPSDECIYIRGQAERQFFKFLYVGAGTYGYRHDQGAFPDYGIFEKSTWEHIYFEGQSEDAVFFDNMAVSGSCHFNFTKIISCQKHAWHIKGVMGGMVWTVPMFEVCGLAGGSANTTGSITSGLPTLTVASGTGISDGDTISVRGAGTIGGDLNTTVSSGGGTTTLTLADNADTTVSSELVTTRSYDLFHFEETTGHGNPTNITMIGGFLAGGSKVRYTIYNPEFGWVRNILLLGVGGDKGASSSAVVYDPYSRVTAIASPIGIRVLYSGVRPAGQRGETSTLSSGEILTTEENPPTQIGTARGKDWSAWLLDSAGNGTGTLGDFVVYGSLATPTVFLRLDGDTKIFSTRHKLYPGNFTSGTGASPIEGTKGIIYGDAAPTAGTWVLGDVVMNTTHAIGSPAFWKCTVAGTPGTWVAERRRGTFTMDADASTSVTDANCTTTSVIELMPTNAAAATLVSGTSSPYVTPGAGSFTVQTADGGSAAGTETFAYMILN